MINLVGYRVLMTHYYMPSLHMAWTEVWLYSSNKLTELTDVFACSNIKQNKKIIFGWPVYNTQSTLVNADMYATSESLCVFRARGPDTSENGWLR